jgi:PAS domain S-box-containing protein
MALSASLVWIFFGLVLAASAIKPLERRSGMLVQAALGIIAGVEAVGLLFTLYGGNFFVESWLVQAGTIFFGTLSSPISPVAAGLIIPAAVSMAFMVREENAPAENRRTHDAIGIVGLVLVLFSFTFILGYIYGAPFLYGTPIIPIAALSALAAFFIGGGLITAGGPGTIPVRYLTGNSIRARLLRTFVPLSVAIVFFQNFAFRSIYQVYNVPEALFLSASLVIFAAGTVCAVSWVSTRTGDALDRAETALVRKNDELGVMNEELTAAEEELRQNIDELGKKQRELIESEHRLGRSQEIAHLGSWELDLDSNHLTWSDEVYRTFGLKPREFGATYEAFLDVVHPDDRPAVNAAYAGSLSEGQDGYEIEHRVVRKDDGGIRYVHEKCEHLRDESGRITRSIGMVQDITERRLTELRLLASEEKFRNLFEKMTEGFALHQIICDDRNFPVDYRFLEINPAFEKLTGLKRDAVVGRRLSEILPDEDPRWVELYGSVALTGRPIHFDQYSPALKNHYDVYAFSPAPWQFAVLFTNITDRKLAEEFAVSAKRKAEEALSLLNAALESTAEGIYVVDKERKITSYNQNFVHIWNIGEVLLKTGDDENVLESMQGQVRDPGGYLAGVYDLYGHPARESHDIIELNDGRIFERYSKPQKMGSVIFGRVWSFRDITAQRRAEEALRESEERFRLALKNAPVSVAAQDRNLVFQWAYNQHAKRYENVEGRRDTDLFSPEDSEQLVRLKQRVLETGTEYHEKIWLTVDGKRLYLDVYLEPLRNDTGQITGVGIATVDFTEQKHVEEALRQTSQYLENLINYANAPIIVWDPEFRITRFNHAFERLTGRMAADVIGKGIDLLFPEPQRDELMGLIRKTSAGKRWKDVEIPILTNDGSVRTVLWNSANILAPDRRLISTIAQGVDITERERVRNALIASEIRYRRLFESAKDGILILNAETGQIEDANPFFINMVGYTYEQLRGKKVWEIGFLRDIISNKNNFEELKRQDYIRYEDLPLETASGQRIDVEFVSNIYSVDHMRVIQCNIRDITARKQADEIVKKTLSLLNAALDSTADGLLVVDRDGKITSYNQSFVIMWNIPYPSLAGSTEDSVLLHMLPQLEDPEGFRSGLKDLHAHPGRESYDMVEFIDGRVFERYSKPQRIEDTIVGRVWSYRDVTERRRAEEALRESEERFRIIATNTPDHILVQDTGLRYTSVINPQLGLSEDDMIGKTDYDIVSKEEADNLVKIKKQVLKTGKPAKIELPLVSKTGEKNYFEGSYIPKFDGSGRVDGLIGYFRNMTEHKSAEEKIISSLAEKEILIREIHHRVKNNLQIISGLLDMTRMRTEDVATGSILTDMMLKIKTMAQIHTRLYESKQFDKINMGGQIRDQVADLSSIYRRSGTEIVSEIDAGEIYLPVDQAIPCALIVNEILSNAFKHAFKGRKYGKVSITAMKQDGHVHITVRDDGIGIPRELDISHATSLGIKLIRNLVQQLGGSLTINGSGGTEVIVEFPLPVAD